MNPFAQQSMSIAQIKHTDQCTLIVQSGSATSFAGKAKQIEKDGNIYLLFQTPGDCEAALQACSEEQFSAVRFVDYTPKELTVSVINLPQISEEQLQREFAIFGLSTYARIMKDEQRESKGVGYVTFGDWESYNRAVAAKSLRVQDGQIQILPKMSSEAMEGRLKLAQRIQAKKERRKKKPQKVEGTEKLKQLQSLERNQDVELRNEMKTAGRVLRKKIKKLSQQVGNDKFALARRFEQYKGLIQKKQDAFFRVPSQLKARREQRKKRMEENRKKANKLHRQEAK